MSQESWKSTLGWWLYFWEKIISKLQNGEDNVKIREPFTFHNLEMIFPQKIFFTILKVDF